MLFLVMFYANYVLIVSYLRPFLTICKLKFYGFFFSVEGTAVKPNESVVVVQSLFQYFLSLKVFA